MTPKKVSLLIQTLFLVLIGATAALAQSGVPAYNHTPNPVPPNLPSLGFQATQTAEFGDHVALAGTDRRAASATVTMSDWALNSDYPSMPAAGWTHPITLNIYAVNNSGLTPALGALLGTKTQSFVIPWRPAADPTCPGGTAWRASNGQCYNGRAFNITFDLKSLNLNLPNQVILGVAYNTQTWGAAPIGVAGPYNSLNVGLEEGVPPSVGIDVESDAVFWNTMTAANYTDGGAGGVGTFRRDDNWSPYAPALQLNVLNRDSCKNGGWQTFNRTDGSPFKNQGDCVSYLNNGK